MSNKDSRGYDATARVDPAPPPDACRFQKLEVDFELPVFMTQEQQRQLIALLEEIVRSPLNQPVGGVHWVAGIGSKPTFSAVDCAFLGKTVSEDAPADGEEPTFDDEVFYVETCAREAYEGEASVEADEPDPPPAAPPTFAMFVIYDRPLDFPEQVVVRRHLAGAGWTKADDQAFAVVATLAEARAALPDGLVCIGRHPGDDPKIAEVWV